MKVINIDNKDKLNKLVGGEKFSQFLQSWQWGMFQEKTGNRIFRLAIEDNGRWLAAGSLIKKILAGRYSYFYCPRGPIFHETRNTQHATQDGRELRKFIFEEIETLAEKEKIVFLRFEPLEGEIVTSYKLRVTKTLDIQPSQTSLLGLSKDEGEILAAMHQKTRYNIRLAEKKGLSIRIGQAVDFEAFWQLMADTSKRDGFRLHGKEYYQRMLAVEGVKLYLAEYNGGIIAGAVIAVFGDTAAYLHGASSDEHRNMMAPYLIQWQAIKDAKAGGCRYYDLYGIDEKRWPGVTRFKQGFGGEKKYFPGTFDLIFNPSIYKIYQIARILRRSI